MKTIDDVLEEYLLYDDFISKEEIEYEKSGEVRDRVCKYNSGDSTIDVFAIEHECAYFMSILGISILEQLEISDTYKRVWYQSLKESRNPYEALGKALIQNKIKDLLKDMIKREDDNEEV